MTDIDWSKAPEGATHWEPKGRYAESWMRLDGDVWFFRSSNTDIWCDGLVESWRTSRMIQRPQPTTWNGTGLPPVGTFILNKADIKGMSEVIMHRHGGALIEQEDGVAADYVTLRESECFPIRTPEQIAADERVRRLMN